MAAAGVSAFAWSTGTFGVGLRTDSIAYIWAARDFAGGLGLGDVTADGIFRPMTHWPPP